MKGGIIYLAESPSEKEYIGQTVQSLARRKQQHEKEARRGSDNPFHAAIRKYGAENIKWKIIARADNIAALNAAEIACIAEHNTIAPNGYNMRAGGENSVMSAETRAKMAVAQRAKWAKMTDAKRAEIFAAGAKARRGVKHSAETRAKMAESARRRWANMTAAEKSFSEEHRAKISAAGKARWAAMSDEEKAAAGAKIQIKKEKYYAETRARKAESALRRRVYGDYLARRKGRNYPPRISAKSNFLLNIARKCPPRTKRGLRNCRRRHNEETE